MPPAEPVAHAVLQALGFALFARDSSGALHASAGAPAWLEGLWPEIAAGREPLDSGVSPFLENFLIDAEECWTEGGDHRASSGSWVEQDADGNVVQLEAKALTIDGQALLLLERLGEAYEAKKAMLQKARETVIAYQRLNAEIQKKEILLHCVADDMTAALANVITSLRLLELENNSAKSRLLLGLAARATEEQQSLIHKVLAVFAEEVSQLFGQEGTSQAEAKLHASTARALGAVGAQFAERSVRLTIPSASEVEFTVPIDARHLERIIVNLLENALEHTPVGGEAAIFIEDGGATVVLRVEDSGATGPPDACEDLFSKLEPAAAMAPGSALRLHFCRMMVEGCGGEIGCGARDGGGNRFWISLPKIIA